ncbi:hypothetical protein H9P43_008656 [Blastocladiella emersonii ATCC 22665]|nr:hypothetical protein H9P43_008656 [Blastocladiella emersonii ATCC 22665]
MQAIAIQTDDPLDPPQSRPPLREPQEPPVIASAPAAPPLVWTRATRVHVHPLRPADRDRAVLAADASRAARIYANRRSRAEFVADHYGVRDPAELFRLVDRAESLIFSDLLRGVVCEVDAALGGVVNATFRGEL